MYLWLTSHIPGEDVFFREGINSAFIAIQALSLFIYCHFEIPSRMPTLHSITCIYLPKDSKPQHSQNLWEACSETPWCTSNWSQCCFLFDVFVCFSWFVVFFCSFLSAFLANINGLCASRRGEHKSEATRQINMKLRCITRLTINSHC